MPASKVITVTPTVDTNIYASGDQLGTVMTFANALLATGDTCYVKTLTIVDAIKQSSAMKLHLFNASPTLVSVDNAALDFSDATMAATYIGSIVVAAGDWIALNANSVATVNTELLLQGVTTSLYGILECAGTPTYTAATALQVSLGILRL
jgi:hypothetical protein